MPVAATTLSTSPSEKTPASRATGITLLLAFAAVVERLITVYVQSRADIAATQAQVAADAATHISYVALLEVAVRCQ